MLGFQMNRARTNRHLLIGYSEYCQSDIERFGMENSKSVVIPTEKSFSEQSELPSKPAHNVSIAK